MTEFFGGNGDSEELRARARAALAGITDGRYAQISEQAQVETEKDRIDRAAESVLAELKAGIWDFSAQVRERGIQPYRYTASRTSSGGRRRGEYPGMPSGIPIISQRQSSEKRRYGSGVDANSSTHRTTNIIFAGWPIGVYGYTYDSDSSIDGYTNLILLTNNNILPLAFDSNERSGKRYAHLFPEDRTVPTSGSFVGDDFFWRGNVDARLQTIDILSREFIGWPKSQAEVEYAQKRVEDMRLCMAMVLERG